MKQVTVSNEHIILVVLNYGAIIQKVVLKSKDGTHTNVVQGFNSPNDYLGDTLSFGACVGRYAGRIANGRFVLDQKEYHLHVEKGVHLHGGKEGFGKKHWTFEQVDHGYEPFIKLSYLSGHLEEGYPGNLRVTVTYRLVGSSLHIVHEANTDRSTIINLTNHSYFRFDDAPSVNEYRLQLNCPLYAESDKNLLPSGTLLSVERTENDFLAERKIEDTRLDVPLLIDPVSKVAAKVSSNRSGISMQVLTNQPALIVYTPKDIPAICFETENFPDAPNHNNFPNCILRPGETYRNTSEFRFDIQDHWILPVFEIKTYRADLIKNLCSNTREHWR